MLRTAATAPVVAGTGAKDLSPAITAAHDFARASRSEATRRAYRSDWAHFIAWCDAHGATAMPGSPETVAAYIADLAGGHKVATVVRHLAAINAAHRLAGEPSPTSHEGVRLVVQGIRRVKGTAPRQARPIVLDDLRRVVGDVGDNIAGKRDRALLLVGWAGALRRSELVALDVEDLEPSDQGLVVTIRRSKTDQEATGRQVGLPFGTNPQCCPVTALRDWLATAGITSGAVFRRVDRHGHVGAGRLSPASVAAVVKRATEAIGLDPRQFSGHSLRSGLATSAAANGATETLIMSQTGHKSTAMVRRYVRRATLFTQNAASAAGL